ncbi:hypothetical protein ACFC4G_06475 [Streptomyces sp. NPDC056002]|uniref:hypothetical protein n=1 Tax=unclassified Streptomyces TaxID=2593676 RepID=UPI0030C92916
MTAPDSAPLHALAEDNLAAASPDLSPSGRQYTTPADATLAQMHVSRLIQTSCQPVREEATRDVEQREDHQAT